MKIKYNLALLALICPVLFMSNYLFADQPHYPTLKEQTEKWLKASAETTGESGNNDGRIDGQEPTADPDVVPLGDSLFVYLLSGVYIAGKYILRKESFAYKVK
ncbi:MAG: hypothetical protein LBG15_06995 [Dysgonamonadaceae bacterium]|jgi:hypothetical protein|nr:hypothetical protein [Dysgonamonadaceae bacterium]